MNGRSSLALLQSQLNERRQGLNFLFAARYVTLCVRGLSGCSIKKNAVSLLKLLPFLRFPRTRFPLAVRRY